MLEGFDLSQIQDEAAREVIVRLLNLVESLNADLREAKQEIQRLRDENARLKGEQGKPDIKPNIPGGSRNYSSDKERKKREKEAQYPAPRSPPPKRQRVRIDREETLTVDPALLPPDAERKGYEDVVVQELIFQTDNVLFHKEKYYSPAEGKTYLAELPRGYQGQFGPQLKSFIWLQYFAAQVSEPKIVELLASAGIIISEAEVSNLLIKDQEVWHEEKAEIVQAGLESSPWQQTDDTLTRVNGVNEHCHVLCNPLYTAYFTLPQKDRLSVIDVLSNQSERRYLLNEQALANLADKPLVSQRSLEKLAELPQGRVWLEEGFAKLLEETLGTGATQQKKWILEEARLAAWRADETQTPVRLLVCDDAGQSKGITEEVGQCWVHDARHYKKLSPVIAYHQRLHEEFMKEYWDYYRELLKYQKEPCPEEAVGLEARFDELFSLRTGYDGLDERIGKTREKKKDLLAVLRHPEVPLHNNAAELGARARVRKRDVSLGPRTTDGVRAWDTGMTIVETAKKLGVSVYAYIKDRISRVRQMPSLAEIIREKGQRLRLGASWEPEAVSPDF